MQTPLELVLPFNVNVTVTVKDLAGNPVKAPKITVTAGNNSVDASSGAARIKLFALTGLKAAIQYPSLNLEADAGAPTGTLQSHSLAFEGKLDMFEAGSLSIRGRLVPVIPTQQVKWVEGQVDSNIGQAPVENGVYDLKNSEAIAPSPEARLTLRAQMKDERGNQWKSLGPEDAGPLPGRSPATAPDLRMATATTIPVRLVDWAGQSLPPRTGKVYRQDQDWNWSPSDSLYLGEYVFTSANEVISIDGQYPATGFAQVAGKLNVSASQTAISPVPAQTLRLPAYWPGSVRVRGTVKVQSTPAGFTPPQTAQLLVAGIPVSGGVGVGARFDLPLGVRVGRGETIQLVASAVSGTLRFGGSVNVTAPMDPPANVEASLTLEVLNPEAADPCPALQSSARQAMTAGNVASVENLVGQLRAKNCSFTEFQNFLDGRQLQGQINGLLGQANAATAACDFRTALLRVQQVLGLDPANGWALQTVNRFRTLAAAQARIEQLLAQAQAAMSNPVEARRLIAEAKQTAGGEKCLLDRIAAIEALIPAAPAVGDILNAAGNNTGASTPDPPPPPPAEETPRPSRKCTVDISADRAQGRAGEQVNLTARVEPFDRVAAVNLLAEGCNPCQTQAGGGGVFTARMKFTGRKNKIPLTFVAIDQAGQEQCRGGFSLESLGAGP